MKSDAKTESTPLLEPGLDALHEQSNEWRSEIAFWCDEVNFLYTLVKNETLFAVPIDSENTINKIQERLLKITNGELDDLQKEVEEHDHVLGDLLENEFENTESYRDKHRALALKLELFEKRLKALKKEIFGLVEHIKKSVM